MKLKYKLIPLFSLTAATGAIAPIASSCSGMMFDMNDITRNFTPTIARAKEQINEVSDIAAQDIYFTHLSENQEILVQDILKYEADKLPGRIKSIEFPNDPAIQEYITSKVSGKVGVRNISSRKVTTKINDVEHVFYALTCEIRYEVSISTLTMDGGAQHTETIIHTIELKDIPTQVFSALTHDGSTISQKWYVSNVLNQPKYLEAVPGWKYAFEKTTVVSDVVKSKVEQQGAVKKTYTDKGVINTIDQISKLVEVDTTASNYVDKFLCFESYHLNDITPTGQEKMFTLNLAPNTKQLITGTYDTFMDKNSNGFEVNANLFKVSDPNFVLTLNAAKKASFYVGTWGHSQEEYKNHTLSKKLSYSPFTESRSIDPCSINYSYQAIKGSTQDVSLYYLNNELFNDKTTKQFSVDNKDSTVGTDTYRLNVADQNIANLVRADQAGTLSLVTPEKEQYPKLSFKILSRGQIISLSCLASDDKFYSQNMVLTDDIYITLSKKA